MSHPLFSRNFPPLLLTLLSYLIRTPFARGQYREEQVVCQEKGAASTFLGQT